MRTPWFFSKSARQATCIVNWGASWLWRISTCGVVGHAGARQRKFSKVSSPLNILYNVTVGLTFENLYLWHGWASRCVSAEILKCQLATQYNIWRADLWEFLPVPRLLRQWHAGTQRLARPRHRYISSKVSSTVMLYCIFSGELTYKNFHWRAPTCSTATGSKLFKVSPVVILYSVYTEWRRPIGCLRLQGIFRERATCCRVLSRKIQLKQYTMTIDIIYSVYSQSCCIIFGIIYILSGELTAEPFCWRAPTCSTVPLVETLKSLLYSHVIQ